MKLSEKKILTTHAGSLPRSNALSEMLGQASRHQSIDERALDQMIAESTRHVVAKQLEAGIDVGNNGEQGRESFFTYIQHRMSGFSGRSERPIMSDLVHYPGFIALKAPDFARIKVDLTHAPKATGAVRYTAPAAIKKECEDFKRALAENQKHFTEAFMNAPSPGIVAAAMLNEHYDSMGVYVNALADALKTEYQAIINAGFVLQLDCPDLAMERHTMFAGKPLADFLGFIDLVVAAINRSIAGLPREQIRMHVCWGNYEGPHDDDVPLDQIIANIYRAKVGAFMISMANPRHAHEFRVFERHPLPPGTALIVGAIDTTTNYVEHPEVVAHRIELAATAVGDPHRILAGTDCGFATSAGLGEVAEEVVWQKLRALTAGAALATKRLLG